MSEKKKTATKKPATKKPAAKKTTAAKKPAAKKTTVTKAKTTTKPKTTAKSKTTATKKTTTKKPTTAKKPKKTKFVKAQIIGYRRNNRLQTTNQAVAKVIEEYNHKALVGKRFVLKFSESDAVTSGLVTAVHGQPRNKQIRLRFEKAGMTSHAINQIIEIQI